MLHSIESDCQQKNCEILAPQEITFLQPLEIFPSTQEHQEEPVPSESPQTITQSMRPWYIQYNQF